MQTELDKLCERDNVRADFRYGEAKGRGFDGAHHNWRVTLKRKGRQISVDFFGGAMVTNPTASDVLSSLILDCYTWKNGPEELDDMGYSFKDAMKVWKQLENIGPKVEQFLGEALDEYGRAEH